MSLSSNRDEVIAFLVQRKFQVLSSAQPRPPSPNRSRPLVRSLSENECDRYGAELRALPPEKLEELYQAEFARWSGQLEREENARFFNQPHAAADFNHWAKAEYWSLDEAIALAMGKAPEIVSWDRIKNYSGVSPFVTRYARLRDLTERAKGWQKLFDPVLPPLFIKWAEDNELPVCAGLIERVSHFRGKWIDWEKKCDELKTVCESLRFNYEQLQAMYRDHVDDWKKIVQNKNDAIQAKQDHIVKLENQLAAVVSPDPSDSMKAQSPIERQNMLKVIFGMAVRGYSYNPADKRSRTVSEIVSDLQLEGVSLSDDTIRRYLKEAQDLFFSERQGELE
ncbi:hypothetical protein [Bradyrhizobium sp. STM 3809]|uniref:hypothetical protein n=1 Tax=Bradyrhizobium sp. STM 3809 TaxID=551936 RepID=UPI0011126220|nr:hypothetical protein [Bradyrhizobium sp. STM 3809]